MKPFIILKKIIFLCAVLCISNSLIAQNQECTIIDDFTGNSKLEFFSWDIATTISIEADPVDATNNVLYYKETGASNAYAGLTQDGGLSETMANELTSALQNNALFKCRYYITTAPSDKKLRVTISETEEWYIPSSGEYLQFNIDVTGKALHTWHEFEYSIEGKVSSSAIYYWFFIEPGNGVAEATEFYIDDIRFCPPPPSIEFENARLSYDGSSIEIRFSDTIQTPENIENFAISINGANADIQSIEQHPYNNNMLILNLEQTITDNNSSITISGNNFYSQSNTLGTTFSNKPVANLYKIMVTSGWIDHFNNENDFVTLNLNGGPKYTVSESEALPGTFTAVIDGGDIDATWQSLDITTFIDASEFAREVIDLTGHEFVEFRYRVIEATSPTLIVRVDVKDKIRGCISDKMPFRSLNTDGAWHTELIDMRMYLQSIYGSPSGDVDRSNIYQVMFKFMEKVGTEANNYTPTLFDGTIEFDYISVGSAVVATVSEMEIIEGADITTKSSTNGQMFIVPINTAPILSIIQDSINANKGAGIDVAAYEFTTLPTNQLPAGNYWIYAFDSISGSFSSKVPITIQAPVTITSSFEDITILIDDTAPTYNFEDYFSVSSDTNIRFSVISDNTAIINPIVSQEKFGLVQYSAGTAHITIQATSNAGTSVTQTFSVTVLSDASNCGDILEITPTISHILCAGQKNGQIITSVSGGTAPYSFVWSNSRTDNALYNVGAGTYSVIVTDNNGCSKTESFQITEPDAITITPTISNPTCNENNGSIQLDISGGLSPYSYEWNNASILSSLSNLEAGIYTVLITDNNNCELTKTFEIHNMNAPIVNIDTIYATTCIQNNGGINITVSQGTEPYSFLWNDNASSEDRTNLNMGNYSVTITDANGCKAYISANIPSTPIINPSIALVTVDNSTGNNLIVWQKEETNAIDFYTIYRETVSAGTYESIATIPYSQESIFEDFNANSNEQSWRYKISATDLCAQETELSFEHKTIHLQKNLGMQNQINLDCDGYEGVTFYSYVIFKQTADGIEEIKRVPASITRYTDISPSSDIINYIVGIELPDTININEPLLKHESGPFSLAMSNIAEVETGITTVHEQTIQIYPTITKSDITIQFNEPLDAEILIISSQGLIVNKTHNSNANLKKISLKNLPKGIYTVQVNYNNIYISRNILLQ